MVGRGWLLGIAQAPIGVHCRCCEGKGCCRRSSALADCGCRQVVLRARERVQSRGATRIHGHAPARHRVETAVATGAAQGD